MQRKIWRCMLYLGTVNVGMVLNELMQYHLYLQQCYSLKAKS